MKTALFFKRNYGINYWFKNFIKTYGKIFLIFCSIFLICFFTGLFSVFKYSGNLASKNIFDKVLLLVINGEATFWKVFFMRIFWFSLYGAIVMFTTTNIYLCWISFLSFIILAYLSGIDCGILLTIFGIKGIMFFCFMYLPFIILIAMCYIIQNCIMLKNGYNCYKSGATKFNFTDFYWVSVIVCAVTILLQAILLPIFNNIFIVVV